MKRHDADRLQVLALVLRACAGAVLGALRGRMDLTRYHCAVARGRWRGWREGPCSVPTRRRCRCSPAHWLQNHRHPRRRRDSARAGGRFRCLRGVARGALGRSGAVAEFRGLRAASRAFELASPMRSLPGAIWPEINTGTRSVEGRAFLRAQSPAYRRSTAARHAPRRNRSRALFLDRRQSRRTPHGGDRSGAGGAGAATQRHPAIRMGIARSGFRRAEFAARIARVARRTLRTASGSPLRRPSRDGSWLSCAARWLVDGHCRQGAVRSRIAVARSRGTCSIHALESHCAGHQFWHFRDPRHPWHARAIPDDLRDALARCLSRARRRARQPARRGRRRRRRCSRCSAMAWTCISTGRSCCPKCWRGSVTHREDAALRVVACAPPSVM